LIVDLARNDEQRRILKIMVGSSKVGRSVMSPPGEPADRVATLRAAFEATVKDPEFLADAKKLGLDINPMSGADLQGLVEDMTSAPAPLVAKIKKLVASND
jgi:tripartite-type tricarboxylate transporter receptor subunit TctC